VTSILFLVASSAFDQTLLEDRVTNRLEESVNIFDTIVNNRCFRSVSIILFFNKTDLLIEKIKVKSIKDHFRAFEVSAPLHIPSPPPPPKKTTKPKINYKVEDCCAVIPSSG
jgi:hypothetical protein